MSEDHIIKPCPWCGLFVFVFKREFNCTIFRHGILRETSEQLNPHASRQVCEELVRAGKLIGCGGPFQVVPKDDDYELVVCK